MSRIDPHAGLKPSMLNRLLDPESVGTSTRPGYDLRQMIDAVRMDLEDLLNSRQLLRRVAPEFVEVQNSIITYGLPDFATLDPSLPGSRQTVARAVEMIIARHEPRLTNIRARLARKDQRHIHQVPIHVDAQLAVEPFPQIGFETLLELRTGQASIQMGAIPT